MQRYTIAKQRLVVVLVKYAHTQKSTFFFLSLNKMVNLYHCIIIDRYPGCHVSQFCSYSVYAV